MQAWFALAQRHHLFSQRFAMSLVHQSVGSIAKQIPGATAVFHKYDLDFCCGGKHSLAQAAQARQVDPAVVEAELMRLPAVAAQADAESAAVAACDAGHGDVLIEHILQRYHEVHRQQLPELIRLAHRVEQVHGDRADCPVGLAAHLEAMFQALQSHMLKEERILFPLLLAQRNAQARMPIAVMRHEHDQHGEELQKLLDLTDHITPPRAACTTWRALYAGLREFKEDLMQHIHLENNVLFLHTEQSVAAV